MKHHTFNLFKLKYYTLQLENNYQLILLPSQIFTLLNQVRQDDLLREDI